MISNMAEADAVEIELKEGALRGRIHFPADPKPSPAVLLSRGVHVPNEDASGLFDDLARALTEAGIALVLYEPRCEDLILDEFHAHTAVQDVEEGMAVLAWMARHVRIDSTRIGLIGYSLGAIAAATMARRTESISKICLLAPATAAYVAEHLVRSNGHPSPIKSELLPASYVPSLAGLDSTRDLAFHDRPTLLLHGAADRLIAPDVSLQYLRALEAAGRLVEHTLVARADHVFSQPATRIACIAQLERFLSGMETRVAVSAGASGG